MKRLILVLSVLVAVAPPTEVLGDSTGAQAQVTEPPSLLGETFAGVVLKQNTDATCFPASLHFTLEGVAFGPYPGTFTEEGTASYVDNLTLLDFQTTFEISSPAGQVHGTKSLISPINVGCFFLGEINSLIALMRYDATITTSTGTFTDSGEAVVGLAACDRNHPTCPGGQFFENFLTSSGVLPLDTTGKATGGGQLGDPLSSRRVTFGFEVRSAEGLNHLKGGCLINDSTTRVKCRDVTSYQQIENTATWTGNAEVNDAVEEYRITIQDNGEPNQGLDTFAFKSDSYEAAGGVTHGNVQVHRRS